LARNLGQPESKQRPYNADANDDGKTVMQLGDTSAAARPPSPPPDDEGDGRTVIFADDLMQPPAAAPSPSKPSVPDGIIDEQEAKTMMPYDIEALMRAPVDVAKVTPPPPAPAADDADEKTVIKLDAEPVKAPAPAPAHDADDDKTMMKLDAEPPKAAAPKAATPKAMDDDGDGRTVIFSEDGGAKSEAAKPPSAQVTQAPADNTRNDRPPTGQTARPSTQTGISSVSGWPSSTTNSGGPKGSEHKGMPEVGMHINQYEVIRKLGEGGMGAVFLARDTRLGRRVAIKVLSSSAPELTQRFIIEARATARVEHENIVSIYEVGEWGGHPFMVLQFLQGQELTKVIPRGKPMPFPRVIELMMPVLRALAYAHGEGIVHRDLKPDNIFVTDSGVTKVLDFGIAKVVQGDDRTSDGEGKFKKEDVTTTGNENMTRHGAVMGTMPYMSPEQWGNGVTIDHTSDIWAVGIMMYKMLSGFHPLHPMVGQELMVTGFVDEPMPSLRDKAPDLPKEVIDVVDKCLEKVKSKRWPDALALLRALEPLQRMRAGSEKQISHEDSPYAGLSSFQEEDAGRFYGRNREIAAMSQRLRERPLMAVVGPSGVGKSSFLRAGVVPALKNSGENWTIDVIRPGRTPLMALASLLVQVTNTSTNLQDEIEIQQKLAQRLAKEPGYLGTALRRQARREKKNILLFVDQFEELYTLVPSLEERLAFTACLLAAADDATSPMRVVVSMRSDFIDRCVEDLQFMNELSQGLFFLTAPNREGMREALVNPAESAGYKFEKDSIVDEMLDHLATTSGALPLLQFTADKLWAERDPTRKVLTEKSYRALGGITGALASHADRILEGLTTEQRNLARGLFLRLVTPDRTRAIVSMDELREQLGKTNTSDVQALIDQMVAARLLVVQTSGGAATVELVHESLIHGWPQLAKWLDEGQEDSAFLEQLRNASRQWAAKNKDNGLLWRGEMVHEAKRFVRRFRGNLPEAQQQFLKAVIDASTRAARIRKTIYVIAMVIVAGLLAAAAVALYIINDSKAETERQAVAAKQAEQKATVAAQEAEVRKIEAEGAKEKAEQALKDVKLAQEQKEAEEKQKLAALESDRRSKEQLQVALAEAQQSEKKALQSAEEAKAAKAEADQRAKEANEAKLAAVKANDSLKVAMTEVERQREAAKAQAAEALRKLKIQTGGGVVEVLQ